jgi:hypothetical protein
MTAMVRIAISQAAFDAIAATLPLGNVGYENKIDERDVWLKEVCVCGPSFEPFRRKQPR